MLEKDSILFAPNFLIRLESLQETSGIQALPNLTYGCCKDNDTYLFNKV